MKRLNKIILITGILLSTSLWADDEFPIELTCEIQQQVVYMHLGKTAEDSWMKHHEASFFITPRRGKFVEQDSKKIEFETITYEPTRIKIKTKRGSGKRIVGDILISRLTLRFTVLIVGSMNSFHNEGQCYKGFKEYEKQI